MRQSMLPIGYTIFKYTNIEPHPSSFFYHIQDAGRPHNLWVIAGFNPELVNLYVPHTTNFVALLVRDGYREHSMYHSFKHSGFAGYWII